MSSKLGKSEWYKYPSTVMAESSIMANDISPKNFKKSVESMKLNLLKTLFKKSLIQ